MTTNPEEKPASVLEELAEDMLKRISPQVEHIKFMRGHDKHKGWDMRPDEDGDLRFRCTCGVWLDDKEAEEDESR